MKSDEKLQPANPVSNSSGFPLRHTGQEIWLSREPPMTKFFLIFPSKKSCFLPAKDSRIEINQQGKHL